MNHNTPLPLRHLAGEGSRPRVLTLPQLREHGVTAAEAAERPWQQILPGVFLLHAGPATSEERLHALLLYAGRRGGEATVANPAFTSRATAAQSGPVSSTMATHPLCPT